MQRTPRCDIVLRHARESLAQFGHSHITSGHLVLGILTLGNGVACNVLRKGGLSVAAVESYLSLRRNSPENPMNEKATSLGNSAVATFERAEADAHRRHNTYLGTEHLLLGIVDEESGEAVDLFASLHIDRARIKKIVSSEMQ
jgi:ATP-dependent Clp protease ATP-binding subunit ClpC